MKSSSVYALLDPITKETCYVGHTTMGMKRILEHQRNGIPSPSIEAQIWSGRLSRHEVCYKLLENGINRPDAKKKEQYWINKLWNDGHPLLNTSGYNRKTKKAWRKTFGSRIRESRWWIDEGYNL